MWTFSGIIISNIEMMSEKVHKTYLVKHQTIEAVSSLSFPHFLTGANNYTP